MARTNKYASINFNDIYEKKVINPSSAAKNNSSSPSLFTSPSSSSSAHISRPNKSYSLSASCRSGMLVLSRPSPKPISQPPLPPPPPPQHHSLPASPSDQAQLESDPISLRPLGKTGSRPSLSLSPSPCLEREKEAPPLLPKSDKFVPPHLRPGFMAREEKPVSEFQKPAVGARSREFGNYRSGNFRSPSTYGEDGRPKSGGRYERMMRTGGGSDMVELNRPGSGGTRPSSSGWVDHTALVLGHLDSSMQYCSCWTLCLLEYRAELTILTCSSYEELPFSSLQPF
ncbi:hypothetical protein Nepgr_012924 [Nepenthes gracilis]|uniref:Uncharacterized protein n=1 Tax=Nepenthes gracilis TaxID=150966 RepID=A0AAD3XNI6_NEPGR|nr:hypothetical protein Nepgr_012924 [Nepenthes gracilis]